jgi:hypothetical protein
MYIDQHLKKGYSPPLSEFQGKYYNLCFRDWHVHAKTKHLEFRNLFDSKI